MITDFAQFEKCYEDCSDIHDFELDVTLNINEYNADALASAVEFVEALHKLVTEYNDAMRRVYPLDGGD